MKKVHENKFSNVIQQMQNSIVDYGRANIYKESQVCTKLSNILGYGCSLEENAENSRVLNKLLLKLLDLPIETRMLLSIMVSRSYKDRVGDCCVPLHEIESATGKTSMYIIQQVDILKRRVIISTPDTDEYGCPYCKLYGDFETDWNYWNDIREFCKKTGILFDTICVKLDFSVFD